MSLPELIFPGRPEKPPPGQPEFVQTPADYLKETTFERLAAQGRKLLDQYRAPLTAIERQFGVAPTVLLAIFGRETDYGRSRDTHSAIRVLATQAYFGKRKDKFREEFLLALKMLERRLRQARRHEKLLGRRHGADAVPAFGFLQIRGRFRRRRPRVTFGTRCRTRSPRRPSSWSTKAGSAMCAGPTRCTRRPMLIAPSACRKTPCPIGEWLKRGFVPAYGRKLSPAERAEPASLLQPAALYGPSFLATRNYFAIKEYNFSDLYVLFVGHLSDRITDPRPFETPWGKVAQLPTRDLDRMQQILTARGYYHDKIDGKAGMKTRAALGDYQKRNGLKVDCWPTAALLAHMEAH